MSCICLLQLVVATGKAPGCAWTKSVLPRLGAPAPGVFMQGLLVYNAQGEVIHSRSLDTSVVEACLEFAEEHGAAPCCAHPCLSLPRLGPASSPAGPLHFVRWPSSRRLLLVSAQGPSQSLAQSHQAGSQDMLCLAR
jgi:hypothetical protein